MAMTLDNAPATRQLSLGAASLTYSFTRAAGNGVLFVNVVWNSSTDIQSVTYDGQAMVRIGKMATNGSIRFAKFRLVNPTSSGAKNVVITLNAAAGVLLSTAISYSGTATSGNNVTVGLATSAASLATAITLPNGSYADIGATGSSTNISGGTNTTATTTENPLSGYYGPKVGTGSISLTVNAGGADQIAAILSEVDLATTFIAPNDSGIYYSRGNWKTTAYSAVAINPGAWFKTNFTGTSAYLLFDVSGLSGAAAIKYQRIQWRVDGGAWQTAQLTSTTVQVAAATGLADATHSLEVWFLASDAYTSRWDASNGMIFGGLHIDLGKAVSSPTVRSRLAYFFGDSITEGAFVDGDSSDLNNYSLYGNSLVTWSKLVADALNADYVAIGFGGASWINTWQADVPPLPDTYNYYHGTNGRLSGGLFVDQPTDIFVNLGTNDAATNGAAVTAAVTAFIASLRAAAPSARVNIVVPFNQTKAAEIISGFNAAADGNSRLINLGSITYSTSDGTHPDAAGHAALANLVSAQVVRDPLVTTTLSMSLGKIGL